MNNEKTYVEQLAKKLNVSEEELIYDIWDKIEYLVPGFYISDKNFYTTLDNMIFSLEAHSKYSVLGEELSPEKEKDVIIQTIKVVCDVLGPKFTEPVSIGF